MIKYILIILSVTALNVSISSYSLNNETDNNNTKVATISGEAEQAPDFTLYTPEGKEVNLSDYLGKIVILDFWATWCGPCRIAIPDLVSIQDAYKDNLVVIGISLDQPSNKNNLQRFIKSFGINYPVVFGSYEVVEAYGYIQAIPTSFIIDIEGNISKRHIGIVPKSQLMKEINSLLPSN